MRFDVTKLPLGEALVGFVLAAVVVTFVLAFAFATDSGIGGGEAGSSGGEVPEVVRRGQELAAVNGCLSCHSATGQVIVGPSWKGIFGESVTLTDGTEVVVDEDYIRESIQDPQAKIVEGFSPVMPAFSTLSDDDIDALIAFIQSLSEAWRASATPTPEASPTAPPAP